MFDMGLVKRAMEEAEAHLFWPSDDRLCQDHIRDAFLIASLGLRARGGECVVCRSTTSSMVELDALMDIVVAALRTYRRRAVDELYHDSESESGYALASVVDTWDAVLTDLAGDVDDDVAELIAQRLEPEQWFDPGDIWLEGSELLAASWEGFSEWIKITEVDFAKVSSQPLPESWLGEQADGIPISQLLGRLIEVIEKAGLVVPIAPQPWYRVSYLSDEDPRTAARLGTPPARYASQANRFSPPGVAAYYAAATRRTAVIETPSDPIRRPVVSEWLPSRSLKVVDLTNLPAAPSYWDVSQFDTRQWLRFLKGFAADVSVPIQEADRIRDYRPTQAVSHALREWGGADGIVFSSSKTSEPCCVLFVDNAHCVDSPATSTTELFLTLMRLSEA